MERTAKPFLITAISASLLIVAAIWSQFHYQHAANEQTQHLLLLQKLQDGIELLVAESQKLLLDDKKLGNVQKQHDLNIVYFQIIDQGSLKLGIAPLQSTQNQDLATLTSQFSQFSSAAAALIQDRANVTKLSESRETVVLAAKSLADKSASLAQGLLQIDGASEHIAASYSLAMALNNHYLSVMQAFDIQGAYKSPDLEQARQSLQNLSTGKSAPASAIIRRSAANLLTDLEGFDTYSPSIAQHHELKQSISTRLDALTETQEQLSLTLQTLSDHLQTEGSPLLLVSLVCWVSALGLIAGITFYTMHSTPSSLNTSAANTAAIPPPASEQTSSHYLNQLKTDKNKLMNDIRPLGEGILYIRADEHLESTGDLARCLNQSREALILKIEALRKTVYTLQARLDKTNADSAEDRALPNISIDTSPIENLTFKAQAELEGLQRKINALNWNNSDAAKSLLTHCLRADRILDEVRVRVKKGWQEMLHDSQAGASNQNAANANAAIAVLINQMKDNLEEFQTEAPKPRRKQSA